MTAPAGFIEKVLSNLGANEAFYRQIVAVLRQQNYDTGVQDKEIDLIRQLYSGVLAIQPPRNPLSPLKAQAYALTGSFKDQCYAFIEPLEGTELFPYPKEAPTTIGIGHLIVKGDPDFSAGLTKQQAIDLFFQDLPRYVEHVNSHVTISLPTKSRVALVSLAFNKGSIFTNMFKLINQSKFQDTANYWLKYKGDHPVLLPRRHKEVKLFLEGVGIAYAG